MKLVTGFSRMSDADFQAKCGVILASLAGNPHFPEPWPESVGSLARLTEAHNALLVAYADAQSRDSAKVAAKNAARAALEHQFTAVAHYLEAIAGDDMAKLAGSGFDLRPPTDRHANEGILPAPETLQLRQGARGGSIELTSSAVPGARAYEVELAQGDPTLEANWKHTLTSGVCKHIVVEGLTPGQLYWFRLRAIGKDGPGLWSGEMKIMVV